MEIKLEDNWEGPFKFDNENIRKVPNKAGIYKILQSPPYNRYIGQTNILEIGMSEKGSKGLQGEIRNHLYGHTVANRLARIKNQKDVSVMFDYYLTENAEDVEKIFLKEFEEKHWEKPVLNSKRGIKRGDDKHFRQGTEEK